MEKRSLIALVLSMAVLFLWQHFFGGLWVTPPQSTQPSQQQAQQQAQAPQAPPVAAPGLPSTTATPSRLSTGALPEDLVKKMDAQFQSWMIQDSLYAFKILAPGARVGSFQLKEFRQSVDPQSSFMELVPSQSSGFLPLAVDLLNHQDWQISIKPFKSDAPAQTQLSPGSPATLSFYTEIPGQARLTKTFALTPDSYVMDMEINLENLGAAPLEDQLGISFYVQPYGAKEDSYNQSQLAVHQKGTITAFTLKDISEGKASIRPPLDWVGYENNYFIQAFIPLTDIGYQFVPRILDEVHGLTQLVYLTETFRIEPGRSQAFKLRLYMGPKEASLLANAGHRLEEAVDYGWFSIIAKPLLQLLNWFYKYLHNYGLAIIVLTILIKIVFWPLTHKSYTSMQNMKKIQPKIAAVREKYANDREKLNQELMEVYRTYKVNPMGGCLPMILQIPVFFALYRMLYAAVELRHEPFIWWINDLTAPDRLDIGIPIPYLGGLPVLTVLMGVSMFIQQKMTPTAGDPRQEQIMLLMPVVFTVFFVNFPSGLVLYWLVNNILSIVQQYWINRNA